MQELAESTLKISCLMVAIWPFLKWFAWNKMLWPFWVLKKKTYFEVCLTEIWAKLAIFYEILILNLIISLILPFFIFEGLACFETAYSQIWPFYFLDLASLSCLTILAWEKERENGRYCLLSCRSTFSIWISCWKISIIFNTFF